MKTFIFYILITFIPFFAKSFIPSAKSLSFSEYKIGGKKSWDLFAGSAFLKKNHFSLFLRDVYGVFYKKEGDKFDLESKKAIYNKERSTVFFNDYLAVQCHRDVTISAKKGFVEFVAQGSFYGKKCSSQKK